MKIHHIGYLVKNIEASISLYESMGYKSIGEKYRDYDRKADIVFLKNREYCVELISPWKESSLNGMMKRYKNVGYHICYQVVDLEQETLDLIGGGWRTLLPSASAGAISETAEVVFLIHPDMGIIELLAEDKKETDSAD